MSEKKPKKRSTKPWLTFRRLVQYLALLALLTLFIGSRRGGWPGWLVNVPLRLDPLAMLTHMVASRSLLAGSALALLVVILAVVFGRAWCGWLCPLGTVLDITAPRRKGKAAPPEGWRRAKYLLLAATLGAALLVNQSLLIFDPVTIVWRTLAVSAWPGLDQAVTATERAIYRVAPGLGNLLAGFDRLVRPALLPSEPAFYRGALLFAGVFVAVVALNAVAPRFWCRYLCPLGGLLGLLAKIGLVRREVKSTCNSCGACARVCPTGTIQPDKGYASDPAECTVCMECQAACPQQAIAWSAQRPPAPAQHYDPSRRQILGALGVAVVGAALLRREAAARRDSAHLIRPPGARENDLLAKCVRCGECVRACPTSVIQPALTEAGVEGLGTPVLLMRMGYCDYSCHSCGQVCPVQAIPPLSLEEKRQEQIGVAYIDQNRCLAWADSIPCIVCEEMCPIPDKAIVLDEVEVSGPDGEPIQLGRPRVVREQCIGCGICEFKCPLNGEAAIRVYVPGRSTGSG